jgi:hypothetical protein
MAIRTFIIYARADEKLKNEFVKHLTPLVRNGLISLWQDGEIRPGDEWEAVIKKELHASELVFMLISNDSISSTFILETELKKSMEQYNNGYLKRFVPILVRDCAWEADYELKRFQLIPRVEQEGVRAVTDSLWQNRDKAWTNVVKSIMNLLEQIVQESKKEDNIFEEVDKIAIDAANKRIKANYELLSDYREREMLESDPKQLMKYKFEIKKIEENIENDKRIIGKHSN